MSFIPTLNLSIGALAVDPTVRNAVSVKGGVSAKYIITPKFGSDAGILADQVNVLIGVDGIVDNACNCKQ